MAVRITDIRKDNGNHYNPHEAISDFRWLNETTKAVGTSTRQAMIAFIEGKGQAYVKDASGNVAYIGVEKSQYGNKYLRTYADGKWTDNLLPLPEF